MLVRETTGTTTYNKVFRESWEQIRHSEIAQRLTRGVFWSVLGAVLSRGMMLFAYIFVARLLGKVVYGQFGMIRSTADMFMIFAEFGLALTATKHVAQHRDHDPARTGRIVALSQLFAVASGALVAGVLLLSSPWLADAIGSPPLARGLQIASLILFAGAANSSQTGVLAGFEAFKTIARINLLMGAASFPLLIGGAYLAGLEGGLWAMALTLVINWLLSLFAVRKEARRFHVPIRFGTCVREWPMLLGFSLPVALIGIMVGPVRWVGNLLLVNQPGGYGELGLYLAAERLCMPILFISSTLAGVSLPILSNSHSRTEDPARFRGRALKMLFSLGILLSVAVLLLLALSPFLLSLYGQDYSFSPALILLVVFSSTLMAFGSCLNSMVLALGIPWYGLVGNTLWAVLYLIVFCFLAHRSATGMALSLCISQFCALALIQHFIVKRLFGDAGRVYLAPLRRIRALWKSLSDRNRLRMATTTGFFRNMDQLSTLHQLAPCPQRLYVFGCSSGCEAYGLAMFYQDKQPHQEWRIAGFDRDHDCLAKARQALYSPKELYYYSDGRVEPAIHHFVERYFDHQGDDRYQVRECIRSRCTFEFGNILDPQFMCSLEKADVVLCQNVLIHMAEEENRRALRLLSQVVQPGGLLVIGGMRLPVRATITKEMGLSPILLRCREIHEGQRELRWLWDRKRRLRRPYIAMPPFRETEDWGYRYGTIFRVP